MAGVMPSEARRGRHAPSENQRSRQRGAISTNPSENQWAQGGDRIVTPFDPVSD